MSISVLEKNGKTRTKENQPKSKDNYTRNEVLSGFLITLAFIGLLGFLFMAGSFQLFEETYEARIVFNYISGLQKNAPVHFAGHEVGKVISLEILDGANGQVAVTIALSKKAQLRKDSHAYIDVLGFMGEKFVEVTPGSKDSPLLAADELITGSDPIALNEIMQKGSDIADELEKTTVSLQGLIKNLDETVGVNRQNVNQIFGNLTLSSENLKDMTHDVKLHPWKLLRRGKEKEEKEPKKEEEKPTTGNENERKKRFGVF